MCGRLAAFLGNYCEGSPFLQGPIVFSSICLLSFSIAKNQLELIFDLLGKPGEDELKKIPEKGRKFIEKLPKMSGKKLESIFINASPHGFPSSQ